MSERRRFKRVGIDVAVKGRLIDWQKKKVISPDIELRAKNLSEGGALLEWPRSWSCDTCSNCLGWIYNFNCRLKDKDVQEGEFNKELAPKMHIGLCIATEDLEPVETISKVAWVEAPPDSSAIGYRIGVSFVDSGKAEGEIKRRMQIIKKRFEPS